MQVNITMSMDLPSYKSMEFSEHQAEISIRSGEGPAIPHTESNTVMQLHLLEKLFLEARHAVLMQMPLELRAAVPEVMWVEQGNVDRVVGEKLADFS